MVRHRLRYLALASLSVLLVFIMRIIRRSDFLATSLPVDGAGMTRENESNA